MHLFPECVRGLHHEAAMQRNMIDALQWCGEWIGSLMVTANFFVTVMMINIWRLPIS